jgi:cytochrome c2
MKRIFAPIAVVSGILVLFFGIMSANSCKTPAAITNKSGAQLWAENCNRCHNAPPPEIYSNAQWEVVGEHMRYKANLTDEEVRKIVAFLKASK